MGKPLYLISAHLKHAARRAAQDRGLSPDEWVYIPYERQARILELDGRTVPHGRYLVGAFGDIERGKLIQRP